MKVVLVIEDTNEIRENICELLELEGYQTLSAQNGRIGIELAKEHQPHLILCDIMMPETSGLEVISTLKSHSETADIPFIFLTAKAEKNEMETGLKLGADFYIRKPFETEELFSAISRCFNEE